MPRFALLHVIPRVILFRRPEMDRPKLTQGPIVGHLGPEHAFIEFSILFSSAFMLSYSVVLPPILWRLSSVMTSLALLFRSLEINM